MGLTGPRITALSDYFIAVVQLCSFLTKKAVKMVTP